jgi:hypothetical protein
MTPTLPVLQYFAAITSLTKARRYNIPHFSLKNVLNIKVGPPPSHSTP